MYSGTGQGGRTSKALPAGAKNKETKKHTWSHIAVYVAMQKPKYRERVGSSAVPMQHALRVLYVAASPGKAAPCCRAPRSEFINEA